MRSQDPPLADELTIGRRGRYARSAMDAPFPEDNPYVTADVYMALELAP